jgi:hypothetical protein
VRTRGLLLIAAMLASSSARADEVDGSAAGGTSQTRNADRVKVHLTGDPGLDLERKIEGTQLWESICVGTCDMQVPLDGQYRVSGRGVRPSLPIALIPAKNVLRLDTTPAYSAAFAGGITLVIVGSLAIFGGVIAATVGANPQSPPCAFDGSCGAEPVGHGELIGGVLSVLTGALVVAVGAIVIAIGDHTRTRDAVALSGDGLTVRF